MYSSFNIKMSKLFKKKEDDLPFRPGTVVSIKHEIFPEPVLSLVQETEGKYLYIAYPKEFKSYSIQLGDPISCRIKNIDCEYFSRSSVIIFKHREIVIHQRGFRKDPGYNSFSKSQFSSGIRP